MHPSYHNPSIALMKLCRQMYTPKKEVPKHRLLVFPKRNSKVLTAR